MPTRVQLEQSGTKDQPGRIRGALRQVLGGRLLAGARALGVSLMFVLVIPFIVSMAEGAQGKPPTNVLPGGVAGLRVSGPSSATAGSTAQYSVTAVGATGSTASGYRGTVQFTSADPAAGLPSSYTFTAIDKGTHAFAATFETAGPQTLTATDATTASLNGSASVTVGAGPAVSLALAGLVDGTAGLPQQLTVTLHDEFGNVATGYAGTVAFESSDTAAVLPGDYTFVPGDAGSHGFPASLRTAGSQTVTAADTLDAGLESEASADVAPGVAASLRLEADAALGIIGGAPLMTAGAAADVTVTALDAYGNVATGYAGTVRFETTDCSVHWPAILVVNPGVSPCNGTYAFIGDDHGTRTFTGLTFFARHVYFERTTLTVADSSHPAVAGQLAFQVKPGPAIAYSACPQPKNITAATPDLLKAFPVIGINDLVRLDFYAVDAWGNDASTPKPGSIFFPYAIPGYVGFAHATSSDPQFGPTNTAAFGGSGNGLPFRPPNAVVALFRTEGMQTLTLHDDAAVNPLADRTCAFSIEGPRAFTGTIHVADAYTTQRNTVVLRAAEFIPGNDVGTELTSISGPFNSDGHQLGSLTTLVSPPTPGGPGLPPFPASAILVWDLSTGPDLTCSTAHVCDHLGDWVIGYRLEDDFGNVSVGVIKVDLFSNYSTPLGAQLSSGNLLVATLDTVVPMNVPLDSTVISLNGAVATIQVTGFSFADPAHPLETPVYADVPIAGGSLQAGDSLSIIIGGNTNLETIDGTTIQSGDFRSVEILQPTIPNPDANRLTSQTSAIFNVRDCQESADCFVGWNDPASATIATVLLIISLGLLLPAFIG